MKFDFTNTKIFIRPGTTDMRTAKEELLHVIKDLMRSDPFSGAVFMFCNSQRKILKMLWWDRSGFWTAQKTLEKGRWPWPDTMEQVRELDMEKVEMLLRGIDFFQEHEELNYSRFD